MKKIAFILIIALVMIRAVGCASLGNSDEETVSSEVICSTINKTDIEPKEGYIIDYNIENKDKKLIFYENKEDNILSVNIDTVPNNIDFHTLDIYVDRYKINVFKNENDKYELNSIKIIGTPKKKNVNNGEELDFNNVVGERLFPYTPEAKFLMKICYPHYYFNKTNYDRGEYLPDEKINTSMCLE